MTDMLRVPKPTYERRLQRMKSLIEMKAPQVIIYHEACLIRAALLPSRWNRFCHAFLNTRIGLWLYQLADPEYWRWKVYGEENVYTEIDKALFDENFEKTLWTDEAFSRLMKDIAQTPAELADLQRAERAGAVFTGQLACSDCGCRDAWDRELGCRCACHDSSDL